MWAIDIGTTNTGVARWDEGAARPRMVELPEVCRQPSGQDQLEAPLLVPSLTEAIESTGLWGRLGRSSFFERRLVGAQGAYIGLQALERNRVMMHPGFAPVFKPYLARSPLRTIARLGSQSLSARDVARLYLRELLAQVKKTTGERVRDLVVTTPVDAYESYRAELLEIMRRLGVKRTRFIDEPVAAAIGYGLSLKQERLALVVDFGGGTLDIALVLLTAKGVQRGACEVIAKDGRSLGGTTVDRWILESVCRSLGYPISADPQGQDEVVWQRMMLAEACRVKESLFFRESDHFVTLPPDEIHGFEQRIRGTSSAATFDRARLRAVLDENQLFERIDSCLESIFAQAKPRGIGPEQLKDVLMVGGSTLLPGLYPFFEQRFGRDAVRAWQPFEAVAYGACAYAADRFAQSDFIVHDYAFITHDLKTHQREHLLIVPRGTRFPTAPDLWKQQLIPTCSLGEPETMFKLVICEVGRSEAGERSFTWDAQGDLHKLGGKLAGSDFLIVPLNESNPTLGYLRPPHAPGDHRPRLEIAFGVNAERWLCATVLDLRSKRYMMRDEPVVRLL